MQEDDLRMQQDILNHIVFAAINKTDTLYYHQAIKNPEAIIFQKAIIKEFNTHVKRKHWYITPRKQGPKGEKNPPICMDIQNKYIDQVQSSVQTQGASKHLRW